MVLPKELKVGDWWYKIQHESKPKGRKYASVCYTSCTIKMYPHKDKAEERESFWHEVTHAVLHEMDSDLYENEKFVTKFSHLLSKAIDSARF